MPRGYQVSTLIALDCCIAMRRRERGLVWVMSGAFGMSAVSSAFAKTGHAGTGLARFRCENPRNPRLLIRHACDLVRSRFELPGRRCARTMIVVLAAHRGLHLGLPRR